MRYAAMFPGHGLPAPRLAAAWRSHPLGRTFDVVARGAGVPVERLVDVRPGEAPEFGDCHVLAVSVAAFRALAAEAPVAPVLVAGHDVGEITAAVVAGAVTLEDGAALVADRARLVHRVAQQYPDGVVAVVGLDDDHETALLGQLPPDVTLADDNAPGQVVLTGPPRQLRLAATRAQALGATLAVPDVDGGLHSPTMTGVLVELAAELERVEVSRPAIPILMGSDLEVTSSPERIRSHLAEGVLAPVRWRQVQERLAAMDLDGVVEVGPGVLRALAHLTIPDVPALHVADPDEAATVGAWLSGGPTPAPAPDRFDDPPVAAG